MTKRIKDQKNKRTPKRRSVKRPHLDRKYNLKVRRYYIETDYVNGVKDEDGNEVMRPLTDEEKDWLDQFYKETVNTNLNDAKLYTTPEDKRKIYAENNSRNRCLYNQAQKTGKLVKMGVGDFDNRTIEFFKDYDLELFIVNDADLTKNEEKLKERADKQLKRSIKKALKKKKSDNTD